MDAQLDFTNREEAAEMLASRLHDYLGCNPLVLAIPRGAVPMGKIIADRLQGELDLVLVHKLSAPFNPEFAVGAVDETGWVYVAPYAESAGATAAYIAQEKARQMELLAQRRAQYTPFRQPIDPRERVVIIVDDGLATGATMIAALHATRARQAAELVCAIPVAPPESIEEVTPLADTVLCLYTPANFMSVGQFYRHFPQVADEEVVKILSRMAVAADFKGDF